MTTDPTAVSSIDITFLAVYFVVMAALTGLACLAWRGAVAARREADRCANRAFDALAKCSEMEHQAEMHMNRAECSLQDCRTEVRRAEMCANQTENIPEECREMVRLAAEYANRAELASKSRVPRKPKPRRRKP